MSPKRKPVHRLTLAAEYLAELRGRVAAVGFVAVTRTGLVGSQTLWRVIAIDADQPPTVDAIERVRAAVAKADPDGPPVPPPFIPTRGLAHAAWCELGARLASSSPETLAAAVTKPRAVEAALRAATRSAPTRKASGKSRARRARR